jgi:uncharacterized repeat protein (TIGR03803 family)
VSQRPQGHVKSILACAIGLILFSQFEAASARTSYRVFYVFKGGSGDGANPYDTLVADKAANLYGTTAAGGASGSGTVYKLAPDGTEAVFYSFRGENDADGAAPDSEPSLLMDKKGNLYGTTLFGGGANGCSCGIVFKLAPDGTESVLHPFAGGVDGNYPFGGLVADAQHNLYGATYGGGANNEGTIFEVTPDERETVLHSFGTGGDGLRPEAGLLANKGSFFGVAPSGGANRYGAVYKAGTDGTESVLYNFTGKRDGKYPIAELIADGSGNLYGTAYAGGAHGFGTVFRLTKGGTETTLYSFAGGKDGAFTYATLFADKSGNLYGTTVNGGGSGCGGSGCGTIFRVAPDGSETVIHSFKGGQDGALPQGGLMTGGAGNLYGTTVNGGGKACGCGIVYTLKDGE